MTMIDVAGVVGGIPELDVHVPAGIAAPGVDSSTCHAVSKRTARHIVQVGEVQPTMFAPLTKTQVGRPVATTRCVMHGRMAGILIGVRRVDICVVRPLARERHPNHSMCRNRRGHQLRRHQESSREGQDGYKGNVKPRNIGLQLTTSYEV
jgi:hypothetical protein